MSEFDGKKRLMLISNSYSHGMSYMEHCTQAILQFLGAVRSLVFIPYAAADWNAYTTLAREGFGKMGIDVRSINEVGNNPREAIEKAEAFFVGGGNTFQLLSNFHPVTMSDLRSRVIGGIPYLGASAGANLACPTIKTTNDMPIVETRGLGALNLVPFQINPHFVDADPTSSHMGETRERRIAEFHEENEVMVIGLREGSWITVTNAVASLGGKTGAKLFVKDDEPCEWDGTPIML